MSSHFDNCCNTFSLVTEKMKQNIMETFEMNLRDVINEGRYAMGERKIERERECIASFSSLFNRNLYDDCCYEIHVLLRKGKPPKTIRKFMP